MDHRRWSKRVPKMGPPVKKYLFSEWQHNKCSVFPVIIVSVFSPFCYVNAVNKKAALAINNKTFSFFSFSFPKKWDETWTLACTVLYKYNISWSQFNSSPHPTVGYLTPPHPTLYPPKYPIMLYPIVYTVYRIRTWKGCNRFPRADDSMYWTKSFKTCFFVHFTQQHNPESFRNNLA